MQITTETHGADQIIGPGFIAELGLEAGDRSLVSALVKSNELSPLDWLVLRDLLKLSDCSDEALALLIVLSLDSLNRGSLCLRLSSKQLAKSTHRLSGASFTSHCERIVSEMALVKLGKSRWSTLIGTTVDDAKPLILQETTDSYIYFQKNLRSCLSLQDALRTRLETGLRALGDSNTLKNVIDSTVQAQLIALNDLQRLAVAMAMLQPFTVISGGPGTGKTSIIVVLLQCLVECGISSDEIAVVAPTGRAAQRMTESIQSALPDTEASDTRLHELKGKTIHALLGYSRFANGFTYTTSNKLPHRVVIVDEVSMVDAELMVFLLEAVQDDARILFLGDKDQLPSVEAGAVLAELIPPASRTAVSTQFAAKLQELLPDDDVPATGDPSGGLGDHTVVLTESYRSERSILTVATEINAQNTDVINTLEPVATKAALIDFSDYAEGAYFADIPVVDPDPFRKVLDSWAVSRYVRDSSEQGWLPLLEKASTLDLGSLPECSDEATSVLAGLFNHQDDAQILTFVRNGPFGVTGINHYLGLQARRLSDPGSHGTYFHGEPVIVRQNNRKLGLANGDLGIVVNDASGVYRAIFQRQNEYVGFALEALPSVESAFAITVHKSQGSEYGSVLFVLPKNKENPLLCKEILYTGVTRAKRSVCIVGSKGVFLKAVASAVERESGVNVWENDPVYPPTRSVDLTDLPLFQ